jgi:serine/threonine protein phosphatase PrpC
VSGPLHTVSALRAAGETDPGLHREVNEDRFHLDVARGLFMVVDGVGGQAAGGKAADTAVSMLRVRLERETGPIVSRLREAITVANNEIHRLARLRPEWNGMACVLTVVVVHDARAFVGHVGDTRLYKLRQNRIEKLTPDHSPVGEREDAREISELEAMQHPRRNEVYRDVGSEPHEPADPEFIEVHEIAFEPDAALLLCSDGLTDLVDSASINRIVGQLAGHPHQVVKALIDAANRAGGKDNITVVYVEGEQFASKRPGHPVEVEEITRRLSGSASAATPSVPEDANGGARVEGKTSGTLPRLARFGTIVLIAIVIVLTFVRSDPALLPTATEEPPAIPDSGRIVVQATDSIVQALQRAQPGATVVVEPGEYRETLTLKSHVRLVSSVPGAAIIRLPGAASEAGAAIVAIGVKDAAVDGFRIVGGAATPLGTGVRILDSELSISQVEVTGASKVAIDVDSGSRVRIAASDIHDNPGSALAVRTGATATISHTVFTRNGTPGAAQKTLMLEERSSSDFTANVFVGSSPSVFTGSSDARSAFVRDNWFVDARTPRAGRSTPASR